VLSQVDGARWLSLEGRASGNSEIDAVRDAELPLRPALPHTRAKPGAWFIEVEGKRVAGNLRIC